jgi:diguanylate cyclase (GGDEF)-like protein
MSELVELGLRRPGQSESRAATITGSADDAMSSLRGFIERLLALLVALPDSAAPNQRAEFHAQIKDLQLQLAEAGHAQELRGVASSALKLCEQYLRQARTYWQSRELEMAEMVAILREAAQAVVGGSSDFHGDLLAGADRLSGLTQLDDIRELKRQLAREVATLQEAIREKQKRDDETLSHLTERIETLQTNLLLAEEEATLDALTNVPNRRAFDRALVRMAQTARTNRQALAIAMIDIDHFKQINDTHGHDIGDRVLLCAAQWLSGGLRSGDFVARYGGEEFVALLPGATVDVAERRFTNLLSEIAARHFDYDAEGEQKTVRFTLSCGVTQLTGTESDRDLIRRADQALYEAKRKGRNRVAVKKLSRLSALLGG